MLDGILHLYSNLIKYSVRLVRQQWRHLSDADNKSRQLHVISESAAPYVEVRDVSSIDASVKKCLTWIRGL